MDETQASTTTLLQSRPGSNSYEGVFHNAPEFAGHGNLSSIPGKDLHRFLCLMAGKTWKAKSILVEKTIVVLFYQSLGRGG